MVNVIRGDLKNKPVSSKRLADYFEKQTDIDGTLYLGYPIIGTAQGGYQIDALLVSKQHGVVIFHIVEGTNLDVNVEEIQDESFTKVQSKLLQNKQLTQRRKLVVELGVITFAPAISQQRQNLEGDYLIVVNEAEITNYLSSQIWTKNQYFEQLTSVIQAITSISRKNIRSYVQKENSRGAKLKKLEDSIANLDKNQSEAVLETVEGVQRIRGLAGSGKTIVLALKVAYLHAKHPDWNIAVTFNTRSLKDQFKRLINTFTIEHTSEEPDWEKVKIIHAWGSPSSGEMGIYLEICKIHGIEFRDLKNAQQLASSVTKNPNLAFDVVCYEALKKIQNFHQNYDAILIDEAQDFSKHFLQLCYKIVKNPKRLIYAYDELQNLNNKVMESPEELFGKDIGGKVYVQLENLPGQPKQDIILEKCYRNSRPILSSAHALGFGIYRNQGLIQMFDYAGLWEDIGYKVKDGQLEDGKFVKLARTNETSPKFLEEHSNIDDLIIFKSFNNVKEQFEWLVEEIEKNIKEDELKHEDILVIHTNPYTTRSVVGEARKILFAKGINSHLAGVTTSPDSFFVEESITFTSINRAKGNEAAMIYVIDAHECFSGSELARKRNILFTAMTRSKAWLRVLGYGEPMKGLKQEYFKVKQNDFCLEFIYPTEQARMRMNRVNRDMSLSERKSLTNQQNNAKSLAEALAKGEIQKDDLPPEVLEKLKEQLFKKW
ncbi:MAG: DEAD/DEAH box helicase [Xenococcaceae cyanobacterium]